MGLAGPFGWPKDLCPRGVNHMLLPPIKISGQGDDHIKRTGSPSVTTRAKCPVLFPHSCSICHHSRSCSLTLLLSAHSSLCLTHPLCILHHWTLCHFCQILEIPLGSTSNICQGCTSSSWVTVSLRRCQTLYIKHLFSAATQKSKETVWVIGKWVK